MSSFRLLKESNVDINGVRQTQLHLQHSSVLLSRTHGRPVPSCEPRSVSKVGLVGDCPGERLGYIYTHTHTDTFIYISILEMFPSVSGRDQT